MIINLCGQWTANCRAEGQHCSAVSTPRPSDTGSWSQLLLSLIMVLLLLLLLLLITQVLMQQLVSYIGRILRWIFGEKDVHLLLPMFSRPSFTLLPVSLRFQSPPILYRSFPIALPAA